MKRYNPRRLKRRTRLFDIIAGIILAVTATIVIISCSAKQPEEIPIVTAEPTTTPVLLITTTPPETTPVTEPEPKPLYDPEELEMLACVIYQEAGADACCDDCRRRVADVVLNRVADERFPDTIEGVLTQERQYGRYHWTGIVWPERASKPEEANAVARAYRIAEEVLTGQHSYLYGEGYIWQAEFPQGSTYVYCCGIYFGR